MCPIVEDSQLSTTMAEYHADKDTLKKIYGGLLMLNAEGRSENAALDHPNICWLNPYVGRMRRYPSLD